MQWVKCTEIAHAHYFGYGLNYRLKGNGKYTEKLKTDFYGFMLEE